MTGKEFLSEYGKLKSCIRSKKEQLLELQSSMESLRAIRYDKDRVQSSPSGDPMLDGMIKIEEKSNSIAKDIMKLTDLGDDIINRLSRMKSPAFLDLLTRRYIRGESFEQIAVEMGYSYKTTLNYHGDALLEFEDVNEDLKLMEKIGNFGNRKMV
ncbi:MAG: hypothetical protein PUE58_01870 [Lachnospiraceae bacterium]|nr:hypothetical protein [Lachnospiraceae bacterium]